VPLGFPGLGRTNVGSRRAETPSVGLGFANDAGMGCV